MLLCRQVSCFPISRFLVAAVAFILVTTSCTVPKRYQRDKPFVFSTDIKLENAGLAGAERTALKMALNSQLDDSLQNRKVLTPLFYYKLVKPAVFDTLYVGRSKTFMTATFSSPLLFFRKKRETERFSKGMSCSNPALRS